MVARLRVTPLPEAPEQHLPEPAPSTALKLPAHAYLARLAALHDEASETAHLANLLGRAPWTAGVIGLASLAAALLSPARVSVAVWLGLMAVGVAAIAYNYAKAIDAPFDRKALSGFALNFSASLIYAGAAWGAGLFLCLPATAGLAGSIAFVSAMTAIVAGVLRARFLAFSFLVPAAAVAAFCAVMRDGTFPAALGIVAGGLVVAGAAALLDRVTQSVARAKAG